MTYPFHLNNSQFKEKTSEASTDESTTVVEPQGESYTISQQGPCGLLNSSWPMASHDTRHTGLSPYSTADSPGIIKWRLFVSAYPIDGGIAIDQNGTLYFGSDDRYMNAAYPNGTMKWRYSVDDWIETTPAIGSDGTVYAGCWDGHLYAFNPNGTLKWAHTCGPAITYGSPCISDDGTIYTTVMDPGSCLIALNSNGTEKWRFQTGWYVTSAPVIALDGTIIFGSADTYIYAVNPNGTQRWHYKTGDRVMGSSSIAADGTVYMPSWDGYLYALSPSDGSLVWRCRIGSGSKVNPSIGPDGTIYVGGKDVYAIYPNGTIRWTYTLDSRSFVEWSSPAVSHDGIIYFGTNIGDNGGGRIYAINPDGTERWEQLLVGRGYIDSSPAIDADGIIYIGTTNIGPCYLYAFGRGPLIVDAYGPYTGFYQKPVQFTTDAFGGTPPYTYHWDFGDGNSSDQQNPSHTYSTVGNYTASVTVTDDDGNHTTDAAAVCIVYEHPAVEITKPLHYIYILNHQILSYRHALAFGPITIEATANQTPFGVAHVDFLLNDILKATDTQPPYQWTWRALSKGQNRVSVIAYDPSGNSTRADIWVYKYF